MNRPKITVALAIIGNEFEPCIQNLNSLPSASSIELLIMDGNDDGAVETFLKSINGISINTISYMKGIV